MLQKLTVQFRVIECVHLCKVVLASFALSCVSTKNTESTLQKLPALADRGGGAIGTRPRSLFFNSMQFGKNMAK